MSVKIAERMARVRPYGERRIALGPGVVWFSNPDLGTGLCFPLKRLGYRVKLSGPTGHVEALMSFVNPTAQTQTAYFLFPLDRHIAPVKLLGKVGDRKIETDVGPAPADEDEADEADLPAELCRLFAEETENVLAIPLGEVPSGGDVSFQILLAYQIFECGESGSGFSFRLPLMTSQALTTLNSDDESKLTLASGLERGAQVAISIQIEASDLQPGSLTTSQVCGVARNPKGDIAVEYDKRKPLEARDFVMDYHLWTENRPKAWLRSTGRHFLLNFLPPGNPPPSAPRRLVILIDGSEEMNRIGSERCNECLTHILKNLDPADKFALVAFNREVSGYKNGDFVESSCADEAIEWLSSYQFEGAADLKELLRRVVTLPRQADSVLSVLLVAAGRIGNEPELYRLIQGSRDRLRLFPIMLGFRADAHFSRAAARLTGGYAFRAMTRESVSRVAERVLEHTRQPVLEGVGLQDKGLQYQGDSLTPKYPAGLNWRRPITVMGAHTGRGGIEAGGAGPSGAVWKEFLELKPAFHKLLPNVWAHVKSSELDDEAQMLDRAERTILQKVILNLSREFRLLNRYTAAYIRTSEGQILAPNIDASRWYKKIERDEARSQSANELLEKQRTAKDFEGGMSKQRNPGRGLTMKDVLGSKSTAAIFGSKLGHRNKLSPSIKEGLFSKPVLTSRAGGGTKLERGGTATATAEKQPSMSHISAQSEAPPSPPAPPEPPKTEPTSPVREGSFPGLGMGGGIFSHDAPTLLEAPTAKLGPPPPEMPKQPAVDAPDDDLMDDLPPTRKLSPAAGLSALDQLEDTPTEPLSPLMEQDDDLMALDPAPAGAIVREDEGPMLPRINLQAPPEEEEEEEEAVVSTFLPRPGGGEEETRQQSGAVSLEMDEEDEFGIPAPSAPKAAPEPAPEPVPPSPPIPTPPAPPTASAPAPPAPSAPTPPPPAAESSKKLLTPRELAGRILPEARQGKPDEVAKNALKSEPATRKQLMTEMRALHGSLASGDPAKLRAMTESVLFLLADVGPKSELLIRAYGLGYQAHGMLDGNLQEAREKLKFWLTRFAKLF